MADTQSIWSLLSEIPIGTVIGWVIVIASIISTICAITIRLYKIFDRYRKVKDRDNEQQKIIEDHTATLEKIDKALEEIRESLAEQKEVNLKQVRNTIVHDCEDALNNKTISINKLRSLEEMYDEYTSVFHANSYVTTLVKRVRKEVEIIGKIDE